MRRRRATSAVAAIFLGMVPILMPTPASALVKAEVAFQCHAYMGWYPGFGNGVCDHGAIDDIGEVEAQGTTNSGAPFLVAGVGDQFTSFTYNTGCFANEPSLLGTAIGTSTVYDLPAFASGQTTADLVVHWSAQVVGTDITITINGGEIVFANGDSATISRGAGQAQMFPLLTTNNMCPSGGPLQALIQGEVDIVL